MIGLDFEFGLKRGKIKKKDRAFWFDIKKAKMKQLQKQKLYCYVDETGQDTKGRLFLVSVVVVKKEQQNLQIKLEEIEKRTGKRFSKWIKTKKDMKQNYLREIIETNLLKDKIFFVQYIQTKNYLEATISAVAQTVLKRAKGEYEATVYVDGLSKTGRIKFAAGLRKLKIKVRKIRGVRDESESFIRLADAMAGFVRDYLEKEKYAREFYRRAVKRKVIQEIKQKTHIPKGRGGNSLFS